MSSEDYEMIFIKIELNGEQHIYLSQATVNFKIMNYRSDKTINLQVENQRIFINSFMRACLINCYKKFIEIEFEIDI